MAIACDLSTHRDPKLRKYLACIRDNAVRKSVQKCLVRIRHIDGKTNLADVFHIIKLLDELLESLS